MEINVKTKSFGIKKIIFRWAVFIAGVLCVFILAQIAVKKRSESIIKSAPTVTIPSYSAQELLNDPEIRRKHLATRVRDTKFFVYSVKNGDNLWKLAKKYGYSVHTLIGVNPQLTTYNVSVNQKLLIPSSGGSLHPVQKGDSWETIAEKYDVDQKELQLKNFGVFELKEGEYVFIAGKQPAVDLMNEQMQEKYALRSLFVSPLGGRLTSVFGKRKHPTTGKTSMHGGIDIAVPSGTWVGAAADGTVIFASSNAGYYGTAVFIDHKNGYITHYGHLSSIHVKTGQKVKARQLIAKSGATGRVTGPHLHFTIKKDGKSIDPLKFLW
ncbi:MAG: peptidoglycan DD-metalloendopeptidase family protein [Endomicrobium sp.]|jgi:murein DD-endopeptidase MepM/ murein hydrolase activator NlpD|nr:peptidoglycan DD-metalloendopeptidase family protein [Endomicrobium sp.]